MTKEEMLEMYGSIVQSECDFELFEKNIEKAGGKCFLLAWEEHNFGGDSTCPLADLLDYLKSHDFRVYDDPRFEDWGDFSGWVVFPPVQKTLWYDC